MLCFFNKYSVQNSNFKRIHKSVESTLQKNKKQKIIYIRQDEILSQSNIIFRFHLDSSIGMYQGIDRRNQWTDIQYEDNRVTKTLWKNLAGDQYQKCMIRELDFCKKLKENPHSNIVTYLDFYEDTDKVVIIMERLDYNLKDYWTDNMEKLNPEERDELVINIMRQISNGYKHLRDIFTVWFLHRDLLADNIFCQIEHKLFKIGDFGISKISNEQLKDHTKELNQKQEIAQEVKEREDHTPEMDMYTLGVICYHIAIHPSHFSSPIDYHKSNIKKPLHKLIMKMLQPLSSRIKWEQFFEEITQYDKIRTTSPQNQLSNLSTGIDHGIPEIQNIYKQFQIIRQIQIFKIEELGIIYKLCQLKIMDLLNKQPGQYNDVLMNFQLDKDELFEQNDLKFHQITDNTIQLILPGLLGKIKKLPIKQSDKFSLIIQILKEKKKEMKTCQIQ